MADVEEKTAEEISVEKAEEIETTADNGVEQKNGKAEEKTEAGETENNATVAAEKAGELSKLESDIIRQVEYYFGDANLMRDKFLIGQIDKDSEGWVPFSVLLTFKRLAALSSDVDVIINALRKSSDDLVEISEDRTKVRRNQERPIPEHNEEVRKAIVQRTAYAKGFPLDAQISELLEYFQQHERVLNVTMRKYFDKSDDKYKFKGSVFVTFENADQAKNFIEKEKLVYKDRPLERKWQEKYLQEKREERERAREKIKAKKAKAAPEEKKIELPKGTVVHFEGIGDDEKITRELLREAVEKISNEWKIAYIEFRQGDKEGKIRFHEEGTAKKFVEKLGDEKLTVKEGVEVTVRTLTDDEETEFLAKVVQDMMNARKNSKSDKFGGRKRRHGNFNNNKGKKQRMGDD